MRNACGAATVQPQTTLPEIPCDPLYNITVSLALSPPTHRGTTIAIARDRAMGIEIFAVIAFDPRLALISNVVLVLVFANRTPKAGANLCAGPSKPRACVANCLRGAIPIMSSSSLIFASGALREGRQMRKTRGRNVRARRVHIGFNEMTRLNEMIRLRTYPVGQEMHLAAVAVSPCQ
jgi:hypothetical protein